MRMLRQKRQRQVKLNRGLSAIPPFSCEAEHMDTHSCVCVCVCEVHGAVALDLDLCAISNRDANPLVAANKHRSGNKHPTSRAHTTKGSRLALLVARNISRPTQTLPRPSGHLVMRIEWQRLLPAGSIQKARNRNRRRTRRRCPPLYRQMQEALVKFFCI